LGLSKINYLLFSLSLSSPIGSEGHNLRIGRPRLEITNSVVEGYLPYIIRLLTVLLSYQEAAESSGETYLRMFRLSTDTYEAFVMVTVTNTTIIF
jgi:hypothetical protein